jgi:hypothetical protein
LKGSALKSSPDGEGESTTLDDTYEALKGWADKEVRLTEYISDGTEVRWVRGLLMPFLTDMVTPQRRQRTLRLRMIVPTGQHQDFDILEQEFVKAVPGEKFLSVRLEDSWYELRHIDGDPLMRGWVPVDP